MDHDVPPPDASDATDTNSWLQILESIGEEFGYFQPLGTHHWAMFTDESTTLLVTFETVAASRGRAGQMPLGHDIAAQRGWSHLCLIANGPTWFRDTAVHAFFDRLVEDAFFEDFDKVIFYGSGMGGYAACTFSVTAPEGCVIAVAARATLDPARTGWDRRDMAQRRLDFTSRYGFAPDMIEGTGQVFLIYDPANSPDAAHAAMFDRANVVHLRARNAGPELATMLEETGTLAAAIDLAADDLLSQTGFAGLWRARRRHDAYLRRLLAINHDRPARAQKVFAAIKATPTP